MSIEENYAIYSEYVYSLKHKNRFFVSDEILRIFNKIIDNRATINTIYKNDFVPFYRSRANYKDEKGDYMLEPFPDDKMGMPPIDKASTIGRGDPYGIPCFYLSSNINTSIAEIRQNTGAAITVAKFVAKRDLNVLLLEGWCVANTAKEVDFSMFLSFDFAKPVSNKELEYLPCQYFAQLCKANSDIIDGIKYRSAALGSHSCSEDNYNYIFFSDNSFEIESKEVFRIKNIQYEYEDL